MKITKILAWIIRLIIFILALILALDNMEHVNFNFFGMYNWNLPVIALALIFLAIGIIIGLLYGSLRIIELKTKIHKLEKRIANDSKTDVIATTSPHLQ
jgi:uncharacterized integral membrane protein